MLHGVALRAESRITQTRTSRSSSTIALPPPPLHTAVPWAAAVTPVATTAGDRGLRGHRLARPRPVIATHGHHRARRRHGFGSRRIVLICYRISSCLRLTINGLIGFFIQILGIPRSAGRLLQRALQRGHGTADLLRIARRIGGLQRLGCLQHGPVARAQLGGTALTFGRLAVERLVDGLAERVPELLLMLAIQRHRLRLGLPTLLQGLDGIDAQTWGRTQGACLLDHGVAALQAGLLRSLQRSAGSRQCLLPQWLQFSEHLFAHMATGAPTLGKLVQCTTEGLPVLRSGSGLRLGPGIHLFDQRQPLRTVFGTFGTHLLQPALDHLVRGIARIVEFLPQGVVGRRPLVGLLPLLAQLAQRFLHLAPAEGLSFRPAQQCLGPGHEILAHLVGAPALPALQLARGHEGGVHFLLQFGIDQLAVHLKHGAQRSRGASAGLAMALCGFLLQLGQGLLDGLQGLLAHFRSRLRLGWAGGRRLGGGSRFWG